MIAPTLLQETNVPNLIHVKVIQFVDDCGKLEELKRILENDHHKWSPGWVHHAHKGTTGIRHERTTIEKNAYGIHHLVKEIKEYVGGEFDEYLLVNRYTYCKGGDNQDVQIFPHRDKEFGYNCTIVGFSLGETSILHLSRVDPLNDDAQLLTQDSEYYFSLPAGSVYIMYPPTNRNFTHEVRWRQIAGPTTSLRRRYSLSIRERDRVVEYMDDGMYSPL